MDDPELTFEQQERAMADLHRFTFLNALSFEVLAGQILILFAREVGASLIEIGLLAGLLPFAAIIQLGVTPLVNRFGPRALMLVGWGARTAVAAGLFLVPAAAASSQAAGTRLLVGIMAAFYLCRALGMSSWLPMVQEIVPPHERGNFLSRQEWLRQVSIVLIAVLTAGYLLGVSGTDRFMHVIALGVAGAAASLYFLWRVPDVGITHEPVDRGYAGRALGPLRDPVFRRYLLFSITLRMVLTAFSPFLILYLREGLRLPSSGVIAVTTIGSLGAIATLVGWGRATDRIGAKPVLAMSITGVAAGLLLWTTAGATPEWHWVGIPAISLVLGIFMGGLTVSMSKFELGFIPVRDRTHYVAANVVLVGLASGTATLLSGRLLQVLAETQVRVGPLMLDRFRIFFILAALALAAPLMIRRYLPEERAHSLRRVLSRELRRRSRAMRRLLARR